MMYPRLRLARNLLKEDGTIFISIDDYEVCNLRALCNEIFGENNFIAEFAWRRTDNQANIGSIAKVKEYILCYSKNKNENFKLNKMPLSEKAIKEYCYEDEHGKFRRKNIIDKSRGKKRYTIIAPDGTKLYGPWMVEKEEFNILNQQGKIYWANGKMPYGKKYLSEADGQIISDWLTKDFGTNQRGSNEIDELFGKRVFDFTKPTLLLKTFISIATDKDDVVLDFFSGSSTTADAVMRLNSEDCMNRKFIMIQLPEVLSDKSEAYKKNYKTICDIGKARINLAGEKILKENSNKLYIEDLDIGFKVFKLDSSNIKKWNPDYNNLEQSFDDMLDNFVPNKKEEDVVYEIMLKYGIDLSYPVEEKIINSAKIFSVGFGALIICLDNNITLDVIEGIVEVKKELSPGVCRIVFKDNGFANDSVKTNAIQILRRNNIKEIMSI